MRQLPWRQLTLHRKALDTAACLRYRLAVGGNVQLQDHAAEQLRYIRSAMERAGSFTAVPGAGAIGMGLTAFAAGGAAWGLEPGPEWLRVWLAAALCAFVIGLAAMLVKARRGGMSLTSPAARKFALGFLPPVLAGVMLTAALARAGLHGILPGMWLALYGAGTITGGMFSVRVIPASGVAFMALGAVALSGPESWANAVLALGFGGVHVLAGAIILRRYGG